MGHRYDGNWRVSAQRSTSELGLIPDIARTAEKRHLLPFGEWGTLSALEVTECAVMPGKALWKYLVLWLTTLTVAFFVLPRLPIPNVSVPFWMATSSLPLVDGSLAPVESWEAMPVSEIWYFLVLSIAGAITVVKILSIVSQSAIAHHWKRAAAWLLGLLCVCVLAYALSLLAFRPGPWQNIGVMVLYATRGPLGPTVVFAVAIILAKFLSRGPQTETAKIRLFLALSGLSIFCGLMPYLFATFSPPPDPVSHTADSLTVSLLLLFAATCILLVLLVLFAVAILIFGALRRKTTRGISKVCDARSDR